MNYSVFSCLQWICLDSNILETMPRKTEEKDRCGTCGRGLNVNNMLDVVQIILD